MKNNFLNSYDYNTNNLVTICNPNNKYYGYIAKTYNNNKDLLIYDFENNRFDFMSIGSVVNSMDDIAKINRISYKMLYGFIAISDSVFGHNELIKMIRDESFDFINNLGKSCKDQIKIYSYEYINDKDRSGTSSTLHDITFIKVRNSKEEIDKFFEENKDDLFFYKNIEEFC